MNFRTALKHLEKLGEANFEEFAEATKIPRHNASVYLSRLFKMGLASRRKDRRYGKEYPRKPYLYQISEKKGKRYLRYEETTEASLKRHYDEEFKRENKYLDLLRVRKEIRDIEKKLAEPAPEKKITYVTRDGYTLHLTPAKFLEWTKFEEEQRIAEKEREERKAERKRQEEELKAECKRQEDEQQTKPEGDLVEGGVDEDLVEWVIGEGDNSKVIKVRPETLPSLIQAQSKKGDESDEVKVLREELKQIREQYQALQTNFLQIKRKKPREHPVDQLYESKEKQMQHEYGLKGIKIFDRENRRGPVREILMPRNTSLRPRDIFDTKFTYEQAMKGDEPPISEPSHLNTFFPRPLRGIFGGLFWR